MFIVVAAAIVFVVAAVAVGRVAADLGTEAYRPRFDLDEAVGFVATALPEEEAGQLTPADVRRLIGWHLDHLDDVGGVAPDEDDDTEFEGVLVDDEAVTRLLNRSQIEGHAYTAAQVQAVLTAELAYLEAIGAIGPPADDPG